MAEDTKRIVEINGVKIEVDLATAKRVDEFRVGDNVKVLRKRYSNEYEILPGVIVELVNFQKLPTMVIAVFSSDYSKADVTFINYNAETKDIEIAPCGEHEIILEKSGVMDKFNYQIEKAQTELQELINKRDYFEKHFSKYFVKEN